MIDMTTARQDRLDGSGFYRVEQIGRKWFVLDPEGSPFHLRGLNHYTNGRYMPWNIATRYGSRGAWRRSVRDRHREWGFTYLPTSVGPAVRQSESGGYTEDENHEWTAEDYAEMGCPFTAMLAVPRRYMASSDDYPDVFSRDFRKMVDRRCREFVAPLRDNPNLIGYHFCHNPPWHDKAPGFDRWIQESVSSPDGMAAWIDLMHRIYGDVDRYRETYGHALASFEEIRDLFAPLHSYVSAQNGNRDRLAYMRRVCEEWYRVFSGAIREYDPNHLLLGDRNTTHLFPIADYSLYIMDRYIDVLSINVMGPASVIYGVMEQVTAHWTGPIHLADTGVGINSDERKLSAFNCRDLDEFDQAYEGILQACLLHPQIVGFGWCGYYHIPGRRKGVVDVATDEPIAELVDVMSTRNRAFQKQFEKCTRL